MDRRNGAKDSSILKSHSSPQLLNTPAKSNLHYSPWLSKNVSKSVFMGTLLWLHQWDWWVTPSKQLRPKLSTTPTVHTSLSSTPQQSPSSSSPAWLYSLFSSASSCHRKDLAKSTSKSKTTVMKTLLCQGCYQLLCQSLCSSYQGQQSIV